MRRLVFLLLGFLIGFGCTSVAVFAQPVAATAGFCPYVIPQRGGYSGEPAAISGVSVVGDGSSISFAEFDAIAASLANACSAWVPIYYGTALPGTCTEPSGFYRTDTDAQYWCTAPDTWTETAVGGGGTDDQTASEVPITDAGAYFTGADAEAALQEVGPTMTNSRAPSGAAGGDLTGTYPSPTVVDDSHNHGPATIAGLDAGDTTTGAFDPARLPAATTTAQGAVVLSTDGEGTAGEVVQADDARLADARTPTAHKTSHEENGGDELLGEALGTGCTDGQILVANPTGGLACGNPGSASFTTLDGDYGDETVTSTWNFSGALLELPNSTAPTGTDCDDAAEAGRVHVDTDAPSGQRVLVCEGAAGWVQQGGSGVAPLLYVRDEKASGTQGGSKTAGSYLTRTLNTVVVNTISGASLSSNQVTLPAGTYRVHARAPAYRADRHVVRLRDITGGTTVARGSGAYSDPVGNDQTTSPLLGRFTLTGASALELQHYFTSANGGADGQGVAVSTGEIEVYAELWIEQE